MVYSKSEVDAALRAGERHWKFRHDAIDQQGDVLRPLKVVTASVANNDLVEIKRTCQVRLARDAEFDYFSERLRSYALLRMPDGGWNEWPVGTFHLSTSGKTWNNLRGTPRPAEGYDDLLVLKEDSVLDRYVIPFGTNYRTAIVTLLESAGFDGNQIATTDLTLPGTREWEPGTPKLTIINNLLGAIDFETLSMDALGQPTSQAIMDPNSAPINWQYSVDRNSVIIPGVDVGLDLFGIPNVWLATISEPDRPVLTAVEINDDPNSQLSTVNRGRNIVQRLSNDESEGGIDAANEEVLVAKVKRARAEATQQYETATFETGLMPFHGSGDVSLLSYGAGRLRYRESEWAMDLTAAGKMKHVYRRVVTL